MARVPRTGSGNPPSPPPGDARWEDHFCPACGKPQRAFGRYPWYICRDCLELAEDHAGRRLAFGNSTIFGGLTWCYADDPSLLDSHSATVLCFIRKRPVHVQEVRIGGVVAEPLPGSFSLELYNKDRLADLRSAAGVEKAREWLKPLSEHPMNESSRRATTPIKIEPEWYKLKPKGKADDR